MKGYKVFNPDWTCLNFKYEIGQTYIHEGDIELCFRGFHFCKCLHSCFSYYEFNPANRVAEVEALGEVIEGPGKSVTNKIKIVRELTWQEVLDMVNLGTNNDGFKNVGNHNIGDRNAGSGNIGNKNSGNVNTGDYNTGDRNIGHHNSGYFNIGNSNTGCWNFGNGNSGYWNVGNDLSGMFNTEPAGIRMFNKPVAAAAAVDWERIEFILQDFGYFCEGYSVNPVLDADSLWKMIPSTLQIKIRSLPNFDQRIFETTVINLLNNYKKLNK